jgi:hypothetical protein
MIDYEKLERTSRRRRRMHYSNQVNRLAEAVNLILPHANPHNELNRAIHNILDVVQVIWGRHNPVDPSQPTVHDRYHQHWKNEREMARTMIKYHKEFKLAQEKEQSNADNS